MKFVVIIECGPYKGQVMALHPAHRDYLRGFLENGQLRAVCCAARQTPAMAAFNAAS